MRKTVILSDSEAASHAALARVPMHVRPEAIWAFWRSIADRYGMRPDSLITEGTRVTGLPLNSQKHWCWPFPLECERRPPYRDK